MFDKKRFVTVMDSTEGHDSEVVSMILKNCFDVKYEKQANTYKYYRLRANRKEVKTITNQLEALGFYATLLDGKHFHVYERAQ